MCCQVTHQATAQHQRLYLPAGVRTPCMVPALLCTRPVQGCSGSSLKRARCLLQHSSRASAALRPFCTCCCLSSPYLPLGGLSLLLHLDDGASLADKQSLARLAGLAETARIYKQLLQGPSLTGKPRMNLS